MKPLGCHNYYLYITTNFTKSVLYIGVTNDLVKRIYEHDRDSKTAKAHFAGRYNCVYLLYFERYEYVEHAIKRETQLKSWTRKKKNELITSFNPEWKFLNEEYGCIKYDKREPIRITQCKQLYH